MTGTLVLLSSAFLLTACIVTADQSVEADPKDPRAQDLVDKIRGIDLQPRQPADAGATGVGQPRSSKPAIYLSDGAPQGGALAERDDGGGSGYDLNFENAPVATVAKVILGDVLNVGYTIDPRVQGTVTLASVRPVPKADAIYVLENALRMSGVALVRDRTGYRLLPAPEAGPGGIDRSASTEAGQGITVVPLRYTSAQNIFKLLDAFGVKASTMRPDNSRNTLIVSGSGTDRATAVDTILSFDADWMRGQSVGIFPVRNSAPEPVISEIEKIMDSGEGGMGQNVIKLQPIARLNSILVVSQKPEYLKRAQTWIARLDRSDTDGVNLKSYPLRYGNSKVVVALLNDMLFNQSSASNSSLDSASSQVAPGAGLTTSTSTNPIASLSALPTAASGAATPVTGPAGSALGARAAPAAAATPAQDNNNFGSPNGNGAKSGVNGILQNVRITADVTNNAVLVYANQDAQRIVEQTIRQIDRPQRQIAIEATIAEVTLNDQLNYGVQFFLASQKGSVSNVISGVSNAATVGSGAVEAASNAVNAASGALLGRVLPGFNFLIGSENSPRVILDALHGVTDVKVLSNPSLVVLDNQAATLQVGDQVPFSTGTATVLTANNTVVNTIDYKNTGIILRVLPRANANGNVVLDIEQEISSVAAGSANSLTPTISQRRVKSSIAVTSGQTVLLAGLISETENKQRQGIPVLDSIPGVGDAFSHQTTARARTELILFIRPTVIKDGVDAHVIAEEMRSKMNSRLVGTSNPVVTVSPPRAAR
ncbi:MULTISPECIES: type II secretion system secretin GspD [unclassified Bradyrhizobium]|uniref:type II secretion system secretin GspD n=1 Tax=unclassified Bradyrhizobium TaxID=2631580 RepID=UPI0020B19226|nr:MULTISPECIES: type II secretion system secretin GspD [unclassified Bradyrhizobium]MCP3445714.1 type II secretion system secretin GspD [Bradyrhizobium sp. CCGUVB14]WFU83861.1 type II secretion system secretin GspD [Bradyrhizobium sp. CIAT3101]